MSKFDEVIFGKKTFGDILQEIHKKANDNEKLVSGLITDLKGMIKNIGDAVTMVPLIAQYMRLGVDSNDHLIKMAAIIQKALDRGKETGDDSGDLSDEEKRQLEDIIVKARIEDVPITKKLTQ